MKDSFYLIIGICGFMYGIISHTYANLEYKGYERAQACTGDCYVKYVKENGLYVDSPDGSFKLPKVKAYNNSKDIPKCDLVIVSLKTTANHFLEDILHFQSL